MDEVILEFKDIEKIEIGGDLVMEEKEINGYKE